MKRHRPPLTREQLEAIQAGHRRNPDIIALLWEIHRLRAIALRANQLLLSLHNLDQGAQLVADALREELEGEPVIAEMQVLKDELLRKRS